MDPPDTAPPAFAVVPATTDGPTQTEVIAGETEDIHLLAAGGGWPVAGDQLEVEWPCESSSVVGGAPETRKIWFRVSVVDVKAPGSTRAKFLLRFEDDGGEAWNSLRKVQWRHSAKASLGDTESTSGTEADEGEVEDPTGFVHAFSLEGDLLDFCDELHARRAELADRTRGDSECGENLQGGLVSVVVRRDSLPPRERELYHRIHHRCIDEVPLAWPGWLQRAGGRGARARPSQDLRLLQYSGDANFSAHVDSGWACQALVYLNSDFRGGHTMFPNLHARYRPKRGRVLMWRSICVGHRAAKPGSLEDHPALHLASGLRGPGTKRAVSLHLVLA